MNTIVISNMQWLFVKQVPWRWGMDGIGDCFPYNNFKYKAADEIPTARAAGRCKHMHWSKRKARVAWYFDLAGMYPPAVDWEQRRLFKESKRIHAMCCL